MELPVTSARNKCRRQWRHAKRADGQSSFPSSRRDVLEEPTLGAKAFPLDAAEPSELEGRLAELVDARLAELVELQLAPLWARLEALEARDPGAGKQTPRASGGLGTGADAAATSEAAEAHSGPSQQTRTQGIRALAAAEEAAEAGYCMKESVWDCGLFIFHPQIPKAESAFTLVLMWVNIVLQAIFVWGAWILASDKVVDEGVRDGYKQWRVHVAHLVSEMDSVSHLALAQRVCDPDQFSSLSRSTSQAEAFRNLDQYLQPLWGGAAVDVGPLMCLCAIAIWFFMLSNEVSDVVDLVASVCMVPSDGFGLSVELEPSSDGESLRVARIPLPRKLLLMWMTALRLVQALLLAYTGSEYLIYSSEQVGDLLLNVAALEVIIGIDELLYNACVTRSFKRIISALEPLPGPPSRTRCVPPGMVRFGLVGIMVSGAAAFRLVEDTAMRRQALEALCGGKKDFVFGVDTTGLVKWTDTSGAGLAGETSCNQDVWSDVPGEPDQIGYTSSSVVRGIMCGQYQGATLSFKRPSAFVGHFSLQNSIEGEGKTPPECVDSFECLNGGFNETDMTCDGERIIESDTKFNWLSATLVLRELQGDATVSSCSQLKERCFEDSSIGYRVRQWCPVTCGCHDPSSPNVLADWKSGCPPCQARRERWMADYLPAHRLCADATMAELGGDGWRGTWRPMWDNMVNITLEASEYPPNAQRILTEMARDMIRRGCQAIPFWQANFGDFDPIDGVAAVHLCRGEGYYSTLKALGVWCPATCGMCALQSNSSHGSASLTL